MQATTTPQALAVCHGGAQHEPSIPNHALQFPTGRLLQVMGVNGVSHHIVPDDLAGVAAVLRWLAFTPLLVGEAPPLLPSADPVERSIAYAPQPGKHGQQTYLPQIPPKQWENLEN